MTREDERTASTLWITVIVVCLLSAAMPALASYHDPGPERGDTSIFTRIGAPGSPEGIYVSGDRVFVGTHTPVFGNGGSGPSHIFVFDRDTGDQIGDITVQGQRTDQTHGLLGMAMDAEGRLYVADRNPARIVRFTLDTTPTGEVVATDQETYATFPELPPCPPGPVSPGIQCSPNTVDQAPFPDDLTFAPDGDAYVTDLEQAVLYRVPAGGLPAGHDAEVWYADARLDSVFATNGIEVGPDRSTLYIALTGSMSPAQTDDGGLIAPTQGAIVTLPVQDASPSKGELATFHVFAQPADGPDGFAFGASGNLYVALAGASQVAVLSPSGSEIARFPGPVANQLQPVPYDLPASVAFDDADRSILVTNQAFFTGNSDHWAVLEAFVDDTGHPPVEPSINP